MKDNRKFSHTICVKNGTQRHRIECSPAEIYGGEKGLFRIRHNRKWVDINGEKTFMDNKKISEFVGLLLTGQKTDIPKPDIPKNTRCSITVWEDNLPVTLGAMTGSEPILDYNGVWQVYVIAYGFQGFYPCKDLILKGQKYDKQKCRIR